MATSSPAIDLNKRVVALDVLRGLAILMVLGDHRALYRGDIGWLRFITEFYDRIGWAGVDLFFVLSGFLIGGLIFREVRRTEKFDGRQFLIRRAFKIWPPYFALLAYSLFISIREGHSLDFIFHDYWPYFASVQNYFHNGHEGHTWSLAVEEHFYLILGIFIIVAVRRWPAWINRHFVAISIFAIGLIALSRSVQEMFSAYTLQTSTFPTHLRLDGLLFGVLLANVSTFHPKYWHRVLAHPWALLMFAAVCVVPVAFIDHASLYGHTAAFTLLYVGFGAMLMGALGVQTRFAHAPGGLLQRGLVLLARGVAAIGIFSYGIYIWHIDCANRPVYHHVVPRVAHFPPKLAFGILMITYFSLAIAFGALMTTIIEFPSLRLREKLFPRVRKADERVRVAETTLPV